MRKIAVTVLLIVLLLVTLSACEKSENPESVVPVVTPAQGETGIPTAAPVIETTEPTQPAVEAPGPQQPPPVAPIIDG